MLNKKGSTKFVYFMILGVGVSVVECSQIRLTVKIMYIDTTHVILLTKNFNVSVGPSILFSM